MEKQKAKSKNSQQSANTFKNQMIQIFTDPDKIFDELKSENETYDFIQKWINWNLNKVSASAIKVYFSYFVDYLYYKGFKITPQDVKHNLTFPHKIKEEKHGLKLEEIKNILEVAPFRKKALYFLQSFVIPATNYLKEYIQMITLRLKSAKRSSSH